MPPEWVLATHNRGKADEFRRLLAGYPATLELSYVGGAEVVEETGSSYLENARLKALYAARISGRPALADDSGLEVDALDGRPGLYSAHYVSGDAWENLRAVLLEALETPFAARTCRMRAVVVLARPDGVLIHAEGIVQGHLAGYPRGTRGFGYDPAFVLPDGRTMAELWPEEKDAWSHRGRAVRTLLQELKMAPPGLFA